MNAENEMTASLLRCIFVESVLVLLKVVNVLQQLAFSRQGNMREQDVYHM